MKRHMAMKIVNNVNRSGTIGSTFCDDPKDLVEIRKIAEELKPLLAEEFQIIVDECVEQYERKDIVVMVAGEVSVGKSSLLNTLLGKPVLLTDLTETTAAITYLRSAEGDRSAKADMAKVTYNDGHIEWLELKKTSLMKVTTSLKNDDALKRVKKVDIYVSGNIIPPGVTIVDTPGLNGGDKHSALTRREMGLCHAALFLLDASKAGTLTEQVELNHLYDYAPIVLFVLSKWDQVRKVNRGLTMNEIKSLYMDSIGKITHDVVKGKAISAENVYVVSAKEGLEARSKFENELKKMKKEGSIRKIEIRDYLPDKGESNEIFDLFADLKQILDDETKKRMIRLRPLLTMCNLAKNTLVNVEKKIAHDVDTSELDLKISKISHDLENRRDAILRRNHEIVDRLISIASVEQSELFAFVENKRQQVLEEISHSLELTPAFQEKNISQLLAVDFHKKFQNQVDDILSSRILSILQEKIDDFLTFLNNSFNSGKELVVNMPDKAMPSMEFSKVTKKQQEVADNVKNLKDSQNAIITEIANLKKQYSELHSDYNTCLAARKQVELLNQKICKIMNEIKNMGERPGAD